MLDDHNRIYLYSFDCEAKDFADFSKNQAKLFEDMHSVWEEVLKLFTSAYEFHNKVNPINF